MHPRISPRVGLLPLFIWLAGFFVHAGSAWALEQVVFTVRFPSPTSHVAEVEAVIPTGKRASVELMMPVWTPGYYRVENYAKRVKSASGMARARLGAWRKSSARIDVSGADCRSSDTFS